MIILCTAWSISSVVTPGATILPAMSSTWAGGVGWVGVGVELCGEQRQSDQPTLCRGSLRLLRMAGFGCDDAPTDPCRCQSKH